MKDATTIYKNTETKTQETRKMQIQENCGALRTFSQGYTPAAEQNRREDKYGRRKNTKTFIAEMFPGHTLLAFHRGILRNVYKNTIQTCRNTKMQNMKEIQKYKKKK